MEAEAGVTEEWVQRAFLCVHARPSFCLFYYLETFKKIEFREAGGRERETSFGCFLHAQTSDLLVCGTSHQTEPPDKGPSLCIPSSLCTRCPLGRTHWALRHWCLCILDAVPPQARERHRPGVRRLGEPGSQSNWCSGS